jgi:hypothetical protein
MKYISKHGLVVVVALIAAIAGPAAVAEVGVVVGSDGIIIDSGPFIVGIIDTNDPIGGMVWVPYSTTGGTRVLLNQDGYANGDGRPSLARNPVSDLPVVTWGKYTGTGYDIVESHFENGGWTTPAVIAAGVTVTLDPEPFVALDRQTGAVHIVYFTNDGAPSVMHVEAPADLSSWTTPALVSQVAEYGLRPSAVVHQGTLRVAYEVHGSSVGSIPRQIVVATSDGAGGFSHETVTSTHFGDPNRPQLHVGTGDTLWVDWVDDDDMMAWSEWHPASSWSAVQLESFADPGDRAFHVRSRIKRLATQ